MSTRAHQRTGRRWRPSLWFVLLGALAATLGVTFCGLVVFRYLGAETGFRNAAYLIAPIIVGLTAVLGAVLVRLLLRPITALETYASAQRDPELSNVPPPAHFGTSELHRTARAVINMAETLRDREATIRSYTDHVTHEIKTPVSAIRAAVELLEDSPDLSPSDRALLEQIDGARAQIQSQLDALRRAAQARETRYHGQSCLEAIRDRLAGLTSDLTLDIEGGAVALPLSSEGAEMLLSPLIRNAAEHGATHVQIRASLTGQTVTIRVQDNGHGISAGNAEHVFEPFFTTKRDQGGTGMGLAILRNIAALHQGSVRLEPSDTGACFVLRFPGAG